MVRRKIIWTYWQNPFVLDNENEYVYEDRADTKTPWQIKEDVENGIQSYRVRPVIVTPMGMIPIQPLQNINESLQFWMAYTNFDITSEVKEKIDTTSGVEILDIISRYSFRIAVGKAFDSSEVKYDIQKILNALPPPKGEINPQNITLDKVTKEKVSSLQSIIKKEFQYWAIYVIPNGEIDVAGTNEKENYDTHLELYQQAQTMAGGIIYQYN